MAYSRLGAYDATADDGSKSSDHVLDFDSLNLYAINFCANIIFSCFRNPKLLKGINDMGMVVLNDLQKLLLPSLLSAKE